MSIFPSEIESLRAQVRDLKESQKRLDDLLRILAKESGAGEKLFTEGMHDFIVDLSRSKSKYPNNARMFDGLLGEVDELRRAYLGDGDQRAEAFDVAVCAFRIAVEGDAGDNQRLNTTSVPYGATMTYEEVQSVYEAVSKTLGKPRFSSEQLSWIYCVVKEAVRRRAS